VAFGSLALRTAVSEHGVLNTALSIADGKVRACYSGDGGPTAETRELYRGATLLVHECFAPAGPRPGHADAETLLALADELEVGTLALVHLSHEEKVEYGRWCAGRAPGAACSCRRPGKRSSSSRRSEL